MNPSHDLQGLKKKAKETFLYVLSALLLGIAIGAIDAVFGRVLLFITDFRSAHVVVLLPFLPLAGLGIVWLYRHFNETASKGMTLVMEAGQGKRESIPLALIPLVMAGTWITHLFGGSAGREGVAVQIGATLSHAFARRFHFPDNGRIVLIAGMAAGFGGLFQTPFAAVFFAMEVVVSGSMAYSALLPAAIASFTASATSHALGLEKFSVLLSQTLSLTDTKTVTYLILFGILFGLTGRLFAVLLQKVKQFMGNVLENPYKRIGFVSIPLAVFLFLAWNGRYCGLGTNLIAQAFSGGELYMFDWILKLFFTVLTLSIGFQGGEVTPLFSIGASLGFVLGSLTGLPPIVCAALGYAAVFGSATNTLLAPVLIGMEVFGVENGLAFFAVCLVAFLVNGNRCIYTAQKRSFW